MGKFIPLMNAELTAAGMPEIIIPTVYRIDYIDALKCLTRDGEPATIIRAMERVRLWSSGLDGSDYDALKAYLELCNAFRSEQEYILTFESKKWYYGKEKRNNNSLRRG